ncbi:hypothetical protein [Pseudoalteromonas phenolica]|uniref:Uncharacterized protein n=1 Tax=Pseudoalteromonas phenolica TaxID=161398 RepID=A0A0S2K728_9GAMM|nr:hypothetical protein [Pseudoalteromonas phenolica]ALO44139.1 hypothetical protein PP2015_3666 [Pseudoalteromonas phenolica]MBE0357127.1 hypothetical protein [Pseudoalteromonas phenolica O-BC30]
MDALQGWFSPWMERLKAHQKLELLNSPCAKVTLLRNVYFAPLSIALFEEKAR